MTMTGHHKVIDHGRCEHSSLLLKCRTKYVIITLVSVLVFRTGGPATAFFLCFGRITEEIVPASNTWIKLLFT